MPTLRCRTSRGQRQRIYLSDNEIVIEDGATRYSDADWAGDLDDRHFTSGYIFLLAGAAVSRLSKKQSIMALSTAEAEYVALSLATQEALWLRRLLKDTGMPPKGSTVVHEDNQRAIAIA